MIQSQLVMNNQEIPCKSQLTYNLIEHQNRLRLILPYHEPEVRHCVGERPLAKDIAPICLLMRDQRCIDVIGVDVLSFQHNARVIVWIDILISVESPIVC